MDILIRFGIALVIIVSGVVAYSMWTRIRLSNLRRSAKQSHSFGLEEYRKGTPAILYFTTPDCAPCKMVQGPAIETLRNEYGERLQIFKIDASDRIDVADHWGVLSVPTTFIIDAKGQPRHINNGVASAAKLRQQLHEFTGLDDPTKRNTKVGLSHVPMER